MNIFLLLTLALLIIIVLLRFKIQIGLCMLASGLFIWALRSASPISLLQAFYETFTLSRTYDIIFALYFVMCLEIELRLSGALTDMVKALRRMCSDVKILLAAMPAFLGLLPSVGGARFSAPIVQELSERLTLTPEHKSAINFWFRHLFEFSSPIIPGMIMACSIAEVTFGEFISHLCWVTVAAIAIGWIILIRPIKIPHETKKVESAAEIRHERNGLLLALLPVASVFMIVVFFGLNASIATGAVVAAWIIVLAAVKRPVGVKEIFFGAFDWKMTLNICCILYFIQILSVTEVLGEIVAAFQASPLPVPVIIACVSFIIGILTGMSQGHVAIVMPIVAALGTGNLNLAGVAMAFGVAGQMLTPTHVCLIVTIDYFKADLFGTLKPVLLGEILLLTVFSLYTWLTW
ncbi:MAG: DUF401 family protein [Selenomonadaceae bacterium]|nr:DUF401 family protein [Selenomonadaceae bacterium]